MFVLSKPLLQSRHEDWTNQFFLRCTILPLHHGKALPLYTHSLRDILYLPTTPFPYRSFNPSYSWSCTVYHLESSLVERILSILCYDVANSPSSFHSFLMKLLSVTGFWSGVPRSSMASVRSCPRWTRRSPVKLLPSRTDILHLHNRHTSRVGEGAELTSEHAHPYDVDDAGVESSSRPSSPCCFRSRHDWSHICQGQYLYPMSLPIDAYSLCPCPWHGVSHSLQSPAIPYSFTWIRRYYSG